MATGSEVSLTTDQRVELSSIAQSRSLPAGYVFRAKLILMLAEGTPFNTIKRRLQTSAPTIIRWKQRSLQSGLDGPSRPEGHGADARIAGPDSVGHPQETSRWFHALELPQTGGDAEREQRHRASGLERSPPETPSRSVTSPATIPSSKAKRPIFSLCT